jgi:menaquinone-dependent protoporphyrinogen oxidase
MQILIAYASCTGATRKIAEHISERLTTTPATPHITTVLHSVSSPNPTDLFESTPESYNDIALEPFDAIIIGSAIHAQKWMPEAERLVAKVQKEAGGGAGGKGNGTGKPVFAFSVGVPNAMPLGIGGMLGRAEDKKLDAELRGKLGGALRGHRLFNGVWTKEMLGRGALARVWTGLWGCLGGKFGEFTDLGVVDAWVDGVVLTELGKGGAGGSSVAG